MPKNPYGTFNIFGREIPLTKSGGLNQVSLSRTEKQLYSDYLNKLKEDDKIQSIKELENFFKKK